MLPTTPVEAIRAEMARKHAQQQLWDQARNQAVKCAAAAATELAAVHWGLARPGRLYGRDGHSPTQRDTVNSLIAACAVAGRSNRAPIAIVIS